jgi:DNA-binding SARP family transcriptional activator
MAADALADVLWPDRPPASWTKVVQGCVSRLRRVLGAESIETSPAGYRLRPEWVDLDVAELEDLVARARSGLAEGAAERAVAGFEKALGLWRGRPLTELEEWPPAQLEAARLTELHLAAQEERLAAMLAAGRHHEVVAEALVQAREQPWREGRWVTLALAQYRCGRQADALASIRTARRMLGQHLGLDPGSELAELERAILEQDPTLVADHEVRAAASACPWRGLASYEAEDVDTFFGREEDVAVGLARLLGVRLLVLAGPSGSGKSSLLKAGVVPALLLQGRRSAVCTPGADPVAAITAARAADPDAVLCVDQAEEALQSGRDEDAVLWLRTLADHVATRGPVVLTLRADHLPALAADPDFARLAERGLYLVSPLSPDQLRRVIEEPARLAGLRLEHGLVDLMIRDAEDQPGALPLLSHALRETWARREGNLLTVADYRDSGGISGAVAASAERVHAGLSDPQREQLRWLMLRMAGLAEAGEPARTPLGRDVALADPDRARVLDLLVRTRLVTSDRGSFEIAHEALIRAWPRLRGWLEEDRAGRQVWRHLAVAAADWERLGRPDSELYAGVRLEAALDWAARRGSMPTELERAFLAASEARIARERLALEAQARHERRQNRSLRSLLAGAVVLVLVAAGAGLLALDRGRTAEEQRDSARTAERDALHESLVGRSIAARTTNRAIAALLAVEAYRARADSLSEAALFGTFTDAPGFLGYRTTDRPVVQGDVVPGTGTAVLTTGTHLQVVDLATGELGPEFEQPARPSEDLAVVRVSSDGRRVALLVFDPDQHDRCGTAEGLAGDDGIGCTLLSVYDLATRSLLLGPVPTPFSGSDVALDAAGELVAMAGGRTGDLAVWDVGTGRELGRLPGLPPPGTLDIIDDTASVVFDRRGHVYVGSLAGPVRDVDARTMRVERTFDAPPLTTHARLALTPEGQLVGTGYEGLASFDTTTGARRWSVDLSADADDDPCPGFAVAERIGRFYCGTSNGEVEERDLSSGLVTGRRLDPQLGGVGDLAVSGGDELVVFARGYYRWRLDGSGPVSRLLAPGRAALAGYDASGRYLPVMARTPDSPVSVLDLQDGNTAIELPDGSSATWLGGTTLMVRGDAPVDTELYDVAAATHRRPADSTVVDNSIDAFPSGDGDRAWLGFRDTSADGWSLYEIDVRTGDRTGRRVSVPGYPVRAALEPDGRSLLVTYVRYRTGDQLLAAFDEQYGLVRLEIESDRPVEAVVSVSDVAVSRTGRVVGADRSGEIAEYDRRSLAPVASLAGSKAATEQMAFDTDGDRLLVTADDGSVQLYDTRSWTRLGVIPSDAPTGVAEGWLRPDGDALVVNGEFGVVEWSLDPERLAAAACELAGRNMTRTEWATYMAGERYRRTCPAYPVGA